MSSDTSSDMNFNIMDNIGNTMNIPSFKKETTETDLYLNLLANPAKSREASEKSTSSLNINDDSDADIRRSSKKNIMSEKKPEKKTSHMNHRSDRRIDHMSDHRKDHKLDHRSDHSDRRSSRRSEHKYNDSDDSDNSNLSKARYENVNITEENDNISETPAPKLTAQQQRIKTIDLLRKLSDLKSKGYKLTKEYDFNSSIEEMEYEYDLLKSFADRRNGIKLYKNTIVNITNLVEFFNDKYDPFSIQLDGWSEHMSVEVDSYDDVLEELYEKYKGAGRSLPPEIKLLILIGFSASAFHFSKKHMSNMPGIGGLQSGIAQKIASMGKEKNKFMSEQELNIERQREELRAKDKMMKETLNNKNQQRTQPSVNFTNAHAPVNFNTTPTFTNGPFVSNIGPPTLNIPTKDPRPVINTNESVRDVLNRLHSREVDTAETENETTVNNDRLLSDTTASESKKKKKKPMIVM